MRRSILIAPVLLLLTACVPHDEPTVPSGPAAASTPILTDGRFEEWEHAELVLDDPADAPPDAAVDLGAVHARDEPGWLHLTIDVGRPVNAQAMRGTVRLVLDADGDSNTGGRVYDLDGADAIIELSRRDQQQSNGLGAGLRAVTAGGEGEPVDGYDAGLLIAPTHASRRFELPVRRDTKLADGVRLHGDQLRLQLAFVDATGVRDRSAVATYRWHTPFATDQARAVAPSIAKAAGAFRVVVWNVAGNRFRDHSQRFTRVLAALAPDVVLLDEVYREVNAEALASFFAQAPLAVLGTWQAVIGRSGGRQKNVVASRRAIRPEESLLEVPYPDDALATLEHLAAGNEGFTAILATERQAGLATAGAWVEIDGHEALFVALDLQSAGHAGSPRDQLRTLQAQLIRDRVAGTIRGRGPVVVAGDFNLVGSTTPLDTLRTGLDLIVADAYRLTDRSQATWRRNRGSRFTPGRLDFILFAPSRLALDRAFVFDTAALSATALAALPAEHSDSGQSSDHLPVVADLRWR